MQCLPTTNQGEGRSSEDARLVITLHVIKNALRANRTDVDVAYVPKERFSLRVWSGCVAICLWLALSLCLSYGLVLAQDGAIVQTPIDVQQTRILNKVLDAQGEQILVNKELGSRISDLEQRDKKFGKRLSVVEATVRKLSNEADLSGSVSHQLSPNDASSSNGDTISSPMYPTRSSNPSSENQATLALNTGCLTIFSEPCGAGVVREHGPTLSDAIAHDLGVRGADQGSPGSGNALMTPLVLEQVTPGEYVFLVTFPGMRPARVQATVTPGRVVCAVNVKLQPLVQLRRSRGVPAYFRSPTVGQGTTRMFDSDPLYQR